MKPDQINSIINQYDSLKERAIQIGDIMAQVQGSRGYPSKGDSSAIHIDHNFCGIDLLWEKSSGYFDNIYIPFEYFDMEDGDIKVAESERIEAIKLENNRQKAAAVEAEHIKQEKEKEDRDQREFERLKKKYEQN